MAHGRELFPADRGLQARMVAVCVFTPLLLIAWIVAIVVLVPLVIVAYLAPFLLLGIAAAVAASRSQPYPRSSARHEAPELHALVERVCAMTGLAKPRIVFSPSSQPNSWVVVRPGYPARLFITIGMLELLEAEELEAVVAHELAHIAHHDAAVMTIVAGPGVTMLAGSLLLVRKGLPWWLLSAAIATPVGVITRIATAALSRYRELAADASAVAITGKPLTLARALRKVSGTLQATPSRDLREIAVHDAFNLVAAGPQRHAWLRTHPDIEHRIARIEAMEHRLHTARLPDIVRTSPPAPGPSSPTSPTLDRSAHQRFRVPDPPTSYSDGDIDEDRAPPIPRQSNVTLSTPAPDTHTASIVNDQADAVVFTVDRHGKRVLIVRPPQAP